MVHFLRGYDYEPEYTTEEVEAWSFLVSPPPSLFVYILFCTPLLQAGVVDIIFMSNYFDLLLKVEFPFN